MMYNPGSTYRIQFHKGFTFDDLEKIIPYLYRLGIRTIYASPVFAAVKGSTHGYDGIDPNRINPEIGSLEQFRKISVQLKSLGIGWLQDFVPNHMAYSMENEWLFDFLEKGKMSVYDSYFDKNPDEPLMVPFLGSTLEEALNRKDIKVVYQERKIQLAYSDQVYPLNYSAYADILNHELLDGTDFETIRKHTDLLSQITAKTEFGQEWDIFLERLAQQMANPAQEKILKTILHEINRNEEMLKRLIDLQFYCLCHWKDTHSRINYRRFFTINALISINIQKEEVFDHYHQLLLQLVREDIIDGIRIDHVDGLYDPAAYLQRLRHATGPNVYIVVEKILEQTEKLPADWPVQGTTGYDFLASVNNVLTLPESESVFEELYRKMMPLSPSLEEQVFQYKNMILGQYMTGELSNLLRTFLSVAGTYLPGGMEPVHLQQAIAAMLAVCPVYRYYPKAIPMSAQDFSDFSGLIAEVRSRTMADPDALAFILRSFTDEVWIQDKDYVDGMLHFWKRFMQLSGPLMAKGVEDTLMYNNYRFMAHNEVGDSLCSFGQSKKEFHKQMAERQRFFPYTMNATATHDTKRGEDSRARLQLLSANYERWLDETKKWIEEERPEKQSLPVADQYFVLQALYAAIDLNQEEKQFSYRLKDYLIKAAREAKGKSSWDEPNEAYEQALIDYAMRFCDAESKAGKSLRKYIRDQQHAAAVQSLSQVTLKCTCPGIPDIYQGTEFWDLSFVDPDNRRAVNYEGRLQTLAKMEAPGFTVTSLLSSLTDPALKLFCLRKLLMLRKEWPEVFTHGVYESLEVSEQYVSFIRKYGAQWVTVVVPLPQATTDDGPDPKLLLPAYAPLQWRNIFTGKLVSVNKLDMASELKQFPVVVLQSQISDTKRCAGILLPLFSLPSPYGIGDLGEEARGFISFLQQSGQKLWQILPLNPVSKENFFSPYSCSSAFAGDPMYIDLRALKQSGWLDEMDLLSIEIPGSTSVDYVTVRANKAVILRIAWQRFHQSASQEYVEAYRQFCIAERGWLEDYVLYAVLCSEHHNKPWHTWPEAFRDRDLKALEDIRGLHEAELDLQRWMQFIFFRQWKELKAYAALNNVRLVGDIPFYMSNDSADVWANKSLFEIDEAGKVNFMAGVPPDYFSATGQLWGMPTYAWPEHRKDQFAWWLTRLRHNIRLFDLVRLDHFRAFYDYWEIPGDAATAIEGAWRKGPQEALFNLVKDQFPQMPFIAEDLGEIHQGIFGFKDQYGLPGMRVLQFGFTSYDGTLRDLPHNSSRNSVVYTGTHDNNTTLGWYRELNESDKQMLNVYAGYKITEENVADSLVRMAYATVADTLIIPIQDLLGLDKLHRINIPSTTDHNWKWRMLPGQCNQNLSLRLLQYVRRYNR